MTQGQKGTAGRQNVCPLLGRTRAASATCGRAARAEPLSLRYQRRARIGAELIAAMAAHAASGPSALSVCDPVKVRQA